jgi:hypothetical protein
VRVVVGEDQFLLRDLEAAVLRIATTGLDPPSSWTSIRPIEAEPPMRVRSDATLPA